MVRKFFLLILILLVFIAARQQPGIEAQESPNFHVVVNMVQLNVAVTDKKGNYITGLRPKDFAIVEDGIVEKTATFAEGNEPARSLSELADQDSSAAPSSARLLAEARLRAWRRWSAAPTCSFCLIPATTCIAVLSSRKMRLPSSFARWEALTKSHSILTAGISLEPPL